MIAGPDPTSFFHLSDIHFHRKISDTAFDLDQHLRHELERDAVAMAKRLNGINGVLITGDIAFSGLPEEYEKAANWLKSLCELIGCPPENVWTVPGNHDVNRSIIAKSYTLTSSHKTLRFVKTHQEIDAEIQKCFFEDQEGASSLFKPIQSYTEFAARYGGGNKENTLHWEYNLKLNDGSALRLRGLNSTLVSDANDDDGANKLILGSAQVTLLRDDGVEYLTLCHHPPNWLQDQDSVEEKLISGAKIQLFGHKHAQTIRQIDGSIRIISGATHPVRVESTWQPRYNILTIKVDGTGEHRQLVVTIYPRIWSAGDDQTFKADYQADGRDFKQCRIPLNNWEQSPDTGAAVTEDQYRIEPITAKEDIDTEGEGAMNSARTLAYRFLSLPYHIRIKLAVELELLRDEDKRLQDMELFKQIFRRAKEEDKLAKLWELVEKKYRGEK